MYSDISDLIDQLPLEKADSIFNDPDIFNLLDANTDKPDKKEQQSCVPKKSIEDDFGSLLQGDLAGALFKSPEKTPSKAIQKKYVAETAMQTSPSKIEIKQKETIENAMKKMLELEEKCEKLKELIACSLRPRISISDSTIKK